MLKKSGSDQVQQTEIEAVALAHSQKSTQNTQCALTTEEIVAHSFQFRSQW